MDKKKKLNWDNPHDIDDATAAFPALVTGTLLPPMSEIPKEFTSRRSEWCNIVSGLFFRGGQLPKVKPGIDAMAAKRHLQAVLGSFEPAHEHKEAGAAWLMSQWYELPKK
jgi:hypothetical protein